MNLQEFIKYQVSLSLLEIRGTFKWPEFKALKSLDEKFAYATQNLKPVSVDKETGGGSRAVFIISNRYVLKMARPQNAGGQAGIAQNQAELQVFSNPAAKNIVPGIYDKDPQFHWIVSEIVRPVANANEFTKLSGIDWDTFSDIVSNWRDAENFIKDELEEKQNALKIWQRRNRPDVVKAFEQKIKSLQGAAKNPILLNTLQLLKIGVGAGDLTEIKHWAKTADGRLVILDTGLTTSSVETLKKVGAAG